MSRPNAKASTSPSTPSAPTICEFSRGRGLKQHDPEKWTSGFPKRSCFYKGPLPQLRFGHIPGNALTVEGLQRKLGPFSLSAHPGLIAPAITQVHLMIGGASLHIHSGEYP